jgi:serine/threonine-protein kinase RsbW
MIAGSTGRITDVKTLHLNIQSQTEKLKSVRDFVSEAAYESGFDEETVNKISIAVDEACTNIIKHSYDYAPNIYIDVVLRIYDGKFEIVITHNGKSFNPDEVAEPDMKEYLTHYRRGGLGMHLMRSLMDRVEYAVREGNKSEVRLTKLFPEKIWKSRK